MPLPHHQRAYVQSKSYEERLTLAVKAAQAIYGVDGPFALKRELREKLFRSVAWWLSEGDGKYSTRYRSEIALEATKNKVQHEHVFPISQLYFLSRHGMSLRETLGFCCACLVTKEEHNRLAACDRQNIRPLGWKRYLEAGVEVRDMLEERQLTSQEMEDLTKRFEEAMYNARFCGDGEVDLHLQRQEKNLGGQEQETH